MSATQVENIRIAGAAGYWGESDMAFPQFLAAGDIDYVVFDYLAEITMSILARAKSADPSLGYATDFVTAVIKPHVRAIKESGMTLISNAGGINPEGCADAIRAIAAEAGVELKVAVVVGDDVMPNLKDVFTPDTREMFSGEAMPPVDKIASANAYLGAFPVAEALATGADIVLTGRCVDSAVTLGACIHEFGWQPEDLDLLAAGSLVGHLIECGPQVTGGNYSDWETVAEGLWDVGYPIAEVAANGTAVITKPENTGGTVTLGTVGEQLLYEIGDPSAYWLPDVVCDFTQVTLEQRGDDRVFVQGARGRGVPADYKVSMTWADGWRGGAISFYVGVDAARKARIFADEAVRRTRRKIEAHGMGDFDEVAIEVVGDESHYGDFAQALPTREVAVKVACRHQSKLAVGALLKELAGVALGAPAGLCAYAGTRPKPSPVIRLYSTRVPKQHIDVTMVSESERSQVGVLTEGQSDFDSLCESAPKAVSSEDEAMTTVTLQTLAWGRSGDKGDKANIGIMARKTEYLPWIAATLTTEYVASRFAHFMTSPAIHRFYLPGLSALNFLIDEALGGGGVASLRNDPQAKCYAQILLDTPIQIPAQLLES